MAPQNSEQELVAAWAALAGKAGAPGWTTIPVQSQTGRFRAGVRHPGNAEALLVGFRQITTPSVSQMPKGRGFAVAAIDGLADPSRPHWFVLSREQAGGRELFATMAADIVDCLAVRAADDEERLFQFFLSRIRAWQAFMQRPDDGLLTLEEQIGLIGELSILERLADSLGDPVAALDSWQGPLHGIQDFVVGHGAIEVKATISTNGFPARISSLEQLDRSVRSPVVLAAVRLALQAGGRSLPDWVDHLRATLGDGPAGLLLQDRLLHAGYLNSARAAYTTAFSLVETRLHNIDDAFPCLARSAVSPAIVRATYHLDLDLAPATGLSWDQVMNSTGAC